MQSSHIKNYGGRIFGQFVLIYNELVHAGANSPTFNTSRSLSLSKAETATPSTGTGSAIIAEGLPSGSTSLSLREFGVLLAAKL